MNEEEFLFVNGHAEGLTDLIRIFCEERLLELKRRPLQYHIATTKDLFKQSEKTVHFHPANELVFQWSGTSCWQMEDNMIEVPADHVILLPRGVAHREFRKVSDGRSCNLNLYVMSDGIGYHNFIRPKKKGFIGGPRDTRGLIKSKYSQIIVGLLDELGKENLDQQINPIFKARMFETVLGFIRKAFINAENAYDYNHVTSMCLQEVFSHVCLPELNVVWLANRVNRSSDYISNIFKKDTGIKLTDFINEQRVQLGKKLLTTTSLDIGEVARSCGYVDPNYFGRVFKKITTITPREFRSGKSLI